jgi:hypothetical protein
MNKMISKERIVAMVVLLSLLLVVYFVFLYRVQIIEGEEYYLAGSQMQTKEETVTASRGDILDRYGRVLISNKECYDLTIDTAKLFASEDPNAVLLELIRPDLPYGADFAFLVQEEVGLRGAGVAAAQIDPDIAVIFEATTAADIPGSDGADRVCELGGGAVISFMDGRTIYDKQLYDLADRLCEENGIRRQTKTKIAGGNDAGAIQSAADGVRVLAVSVPCRYLHSALSVIRKSDGEACEMLARKLLETLPVTGEDAL